MKPFLARATSTLFNWNWNPVTSCLALQIFTTSARLPPAICVLNEGFLPHNPSAQPVCFSRAVTTLNTFMSVETQWVLGQGNQGGLTDSLGWVQCERGVGLKEGKNFLKGEQSQGKGTTQFRPL